MRVEPRHEYVNNDNRPDIVAFGTGTGESLELDISLAHPWSSEACRRAAVEDRAAAIIREERKIENYSSVVRVCGSSSCFVPVVAETSDAGASTQMISSFASEISFNALRVRLVKVLLCVIGVVVYLFFFNVPSVVLYKNHKLSCVSDSFSRTDLYSEREA